MENGLKLLNNLDEVQGDMYIFARAVQCFCVLLSLMFVLSDAKATLIVFALCIAWSYWEKNGQFEKL